MDKGRQKARHADGGRVCPGSGHLCCRATVEQEGSYGAGFGEQIEGSDDRFLSNPIEYLSGTKEYGVQELIDAAEANGAIRRPASEII